MRDAIKATTTTRYVGVYTMEGTTKYENTGLLMFRSYWYLLAGPRASFKFSYFLNRKIKFRYEPSRSIIPHIHDVQ